MHISSKIFSFLFFNYLDNQLFHFISSFKLQFINDSVNKKLSRNWTCFFHAFISVLLSLNVILDQNSSNYLLLENFSSGYFLYDSVYIMIYDKKSLSSYLYLYHHLVSIYIIVKGKEYFIEQILFWAELSNIPSYFVYHFLKMNDNRSIIWKKIQQIMYIVIRIPILGYLSINIFNNVEDKLPVYFCLPVYLMGIIYLTIINLIFTLKGLVIHLKIIIMNCLAILI